MIEFKNIYKNYQNEKITVNALKDINLNINSNEIFGIVGESGSGKSTLLRIINRLELPDSGEIFLDNIDIGNLSKKELRNKRKDIGMIFQQFNLLKNKTVFQNVDLALKMINKKDDKSIDKILKFVGLSDKKDSYPNQLSGGEQQRVAIARALITKPSLLLCDEPTSSLDSKTTDDLLEVLKSIHSNFHTTIVIVTHELSVIKKICNRVAVMQNGSIKKILNISQESNIKPKSTYLEQVTEVFNL